jgi:hypothetical protein
MKRLNTLKRWGGKNGDAVILHPSTCSLPPKREEQATFQKI